MNLRREATQTIWKTVVFAGAMLGGAACHKSKPPATPADTAAHDGATDPNDPNAKKSPDDPCATDDPCAADPCATDDPCARIRGSSEDGGEGRGFILS